MEGLCPFCRHLSLDIQAGFGYTCGRRRTGLPVLPVASHINRLQVSCHTLTATTVKQRLTLSSERRSSRTRFCWLHLETGWQSGQLCKDFKRGCGNPPPPLQAASIQNTICLILMKMITVRLMNSWTPILYMVYQRLHPSWITLAKFTKTRKDL